MNILFPKSPCVKGMVPKMALLGGGRTFKRQGLVEGLAEGLQVTEGVPSKGIVRLHLPPCSLACDVSGFTLPRVPAMMHSLTIGPKHKSQSIME